jgi:hypothetical protein
VSGKTIAAVKTTEIYKGSIAFICLQLTMLVAVMVFPNLVTGGIEKVETLSADQIMEQLQMPATEEPAADAPAEAASGADPASPTDAKTDEVDPMKAMQDDAAKDAAKKQ